MERTFGDFRKHAGHRIAALLRFHLREAQHVTAVRRELTTQEIIHEVDLHKHVDEIQRLADEEAEGIKVVTIQILGEIIQQNLLSLFFAFIVDDGTVEIQHEHLDATTFPGLPQVARNVKANGCTSVCGRGEREIKKLFFVCFT